MSQSVLIVDDDRFLLENLRKFLVTNGFEAQTASSGEEALSMLENRKVDLMILDLGLPGIDGMTVCRRVRAKYRFPVIMLTARTDAMDKVIGLEVGADDYLTKPFEPIELLARVRAQLRRSNEYTSEAVKPKLLELGPLTIDFDRREATLEGEDLVLTNREFELLGYLAQNNGRVISRETIFEQVWGYDIDCNTNSLDVIIYRLRTKLQSRPGVPQMLYTMRGYGYKFQAP
jgi:DNA-binding response OmpR family regulator